MKASADRDDRQRRLEAAARDAFELRADRKLTDAEWAVVRTRLLEFVGVLRGWEQTTRQSDEVMLSYASENVKFDAIRPKLHRATD
jgi:hypothetical protein